MHRVLDFPFLALVPPGLVEAAQKTGLLHDIGVWLDANQGALHGFSFLAAGMCSVLIGAVQVKRLVDKRQRPPDDYEPVDMDLD